jgi:hypothetical protein
MRKTIVAVGAIVLLSTTYTLAQQREVVRVCAADIRAACGDVAPGAGNIRSCLNSHLADLTRPCQAILIGDIRTMCGGVEPGGGRIEACLQSHLTELSAPCIDSMARTVGSGG